MRRLKFNLFNIHSLGIEIALLYTFVLLPMSAYTCLASSLGDTSNRNVAEDAVAKAFGYIMNSGDL